MGLTKLTVNLTEKSANALDNVSLLTGEIRTDCINRAIQLYEFVQMEKAAGRELLLRDPKAGDVKQIHLL